MIDTHNEVFPRPCPGCKSTKARHAGPKNGYTILVCNKCQTIYTSRLPAEDEVEDYDGYYCEANLKVPDFVSMRVGEIINAFARFRRSGRLLDIGFGSGILLQVASENGWQTNGIEVSAPAVEQARKRGFNVLHGTLEEARYPNDHFDVVTASEILEHVPDPRAMLMEVARVLRPGGLFWATTPSATSLSFRLNGTAWSIISPPEHTQLFSRRVLMEMLRSAGFSHCKIKTHGFNPHEAIHRFRQQLGATPAAASFSRVDTGYQLNERLTSNEGGRLVKNALNATLNALGCGDSLKIFARL